MKKYIELYEQMKENIMKGNYRYGDKLPSKRDAASLAQVSLITVQHAYELLCEEGYIEANERSGFYVIYQASDFLNQKSIDHAIHFSKNKNTSQNKGEFPFSVLAKTMRKVITDYDDEILRRPPKKGCIELRRAIKTYLAITRNIYVDEEQVIIGSGAEYLYGLIAQLFDQSEIIAVEDPCYEKIRQVYGSLGHKTKPLKLGKDGILTAELQQTSANILHVTPFHSYPSQITASISKKREYLNWAGESRYIIEDNYDSELTVSRKMEDALFSITSNENVIYMNTFTKTIAPSVRIGYMILPNNLLQRFEERLGFYSCSVPSFEQLVLAELIENGEYQKQVNRIRRRLRKASIN